MLVDLPTAKQHLRRVDSSEDTLIQLYLSAAESSAVQFLNRNVYATQADLDAAAEPPEQFPMVVTPDIKSAILLILGHLFVNREDVVVGTITDEMPKASFFLLLPYRVDMGI